MGRWKVVIVSLLTTLLVAIASFSTRQVLGACAGLGAGPPAPPNCGTVKSGVISPTCGGAPTFGGATCASQQRVGSGASAVPKLGTFLACALLGVPFGLSTLKLWRKPLNGSSVRRKT
jgi:hypothetical protein